MRGKILSLIVFVFGLIALFATPAVAVGQEGRYVVLFENNRMPKNAAALIENAGGVLVREIPEVGIAIAISNDEGFAETISGVGQVKLAGVVPAESLPDTKDWAFAKDGPTVNDWIYNSGYQWNINRVHAPEAWSAGFTGSHNTVVAVIDTGIAWNLPDLSPNVVFAACITHAPGCSPYPDVSIHGTHVAGIIASAFDGEGTVGVAPNLALASYKVFEHVPGCGADEYCTYTDSRWLAMIDAAQRGFEVINMSLGGYSIYGGQGTSGLAAFVAAEKRVAGYVNMMGTTIVASAGNDAVDLNGTIIHLPGDIPNIINVSATAIRPDIWTPYPESYDIPAFYSNYGAPVTVAAPGGDFGPDSVDPFYAILSTGTSFESGCAATYNCPEEYWWMIGTSQAAPHVAAVAGLIKDINPKLSPNQVEAIIKRSAEDLGNRQLFGHGMVDAFEAAMAAE